MSAIEEPATPVTFFIEQKALAGATGALFARVEPAEGTGPAPVERLVYRLNAPVVHYDFLHDLFERKQVFRFEAHLHLQVELSVTAVISELVKNAEGETACLIEFNLP